ncbi:hypothetical protein QO009_004106 [Brevibacillus aydinogluensis]|nr:hypothetical protein [Brevibacillus aydinogluensis]
MSRSRWPQPGARVESNVAGGRLPDRTRMSRRGIPAPADEPQLATARSAGEDLRRCRRLPDRTRMSRRGRAWRPPMSRSRWPQPGARVEICVAGSRLPARTRMPRRGIPAPVDEPQQLATARVPGGELLRRQPAPGPNQDVAAGESLAPADEQQQVATARSAGGEQRRRRAAPGPNQMPWRGIPAPADEQQQVATARSAGGEQRRRRAAPGPNQMPWRGRAWRSSMSRICWPTTRSLAEEICVAGSWIRTRPACRGGGAPGARR